MIFRRGMLEFDSRPDPAAVLFAGKGGPGMRLVHGPAGG